MSNTTDVQLLIGDVAGDLFTDAQIQSFLTMSASGGTENVYAAAALACRSLAASGALLAKAQRIGQYSIDRKSISAAYLAMAHTYDDAVNSVPAVGVIEMSWTDTIADSIVSNNAMRGD